MSIKTSQSVVKEHTKRIIEALLFATDQPLPLNKLREIVESFHPFKPKELAEILQELKQDYLREKRAFQLEEIGGGYLLRSSPEFKVYTSQIQRDRRGEKLSPAALETVAIVAFKGPLPKAQIEAIRGVDSSGILQTLLDRGLIEITGQMEVAGRPHLYGVTPLFLQHFGLSSLQELVEIQ